MTAPTIDQQQAVNHVLSARTHLYAAVRLSEGLEASGMGASVHAALLMLRAALESLCPRCDGPLNTDPAVFHNGARGEDVCASCCVECSRRPWCLAKEIEAA